MIVGVPFDLTVKVLYYPSFHLTITEKKSSSNAELADHLFIFWPQMHTIKKTIIPLNNLI